MDFFKSKMVTHVMWNSDVVAKTWYEADGRPFREPFAPLNWIPITAAAVVAVLLQGAALLAASAIVGVPELPAQANERALSRWDRETLQRPRG